MNDEIQAALAEILQTTLDAKDLIVSEIPDVIAQLLLWHGVYSFILFLIGFAFIAAHVVFAKRILSWCVLSAKKLESEYGPGGAAFLVFPGVAHVVLIIIATVGFLNLEWLQIWIAPKVWLIEYAAKLV